MMTYALNSEIHQVNIVLI